MNPSPEIPPDPSPSAATDTRRVTPPSWHAPWRGALLVSVFLSWGACSRPEPPPIGNPASGSGIDPAVVDHVRGLAAMARQRPRDAGARASLGIALAANGLWKEAREAFQAAAVLDPGEPLAPMYAAIALQELSDGPGSLREFREVAGRFPRFAPAWYRVGEASLRSGELDAAEEAFTTLVRLAPGESRGPMGLGEVRFRRGDATNALPLVERALELEPGSRPALYLLGQIFRSLGRGEEARVAISAGTGEARQPMTDPWAETAPEQVRLLPGVFQQAEALSASGRPEAAVALLERARRFHPDHAGLLNQLAVALNRCGRPGQALGLLAPVLAKDPGTVAPRITRSHALAQAGNLEAALSEAREAVHLASRLAQAHLALANAHLAAEQDAEALSALDEASRCDPANAEILLESATIRWRNLRDAAAALALLDRAIDLQPALVPALRLRAEVQEAIGDSEGARRTTGVIRWLAARTGGRP